MEMVMEARGMQAAIEAITRVNSSSREEVEWRGIRAHLKKPLHQVDCLAVLGGSVKSCSLIAPIWGFYWWRGSKVVCTFHTALLIPQLAAARNLTFTQTVISLHPKPTQLESNPS